LGHQLIRIEKFPPVKGHPKIGTRQLAFVRGSNQIGIKTHQKLEKGEDQNLEKKYCTHWRYGTERICHPCVTLLGSRV